MSDAAYWLPLIWAGLIAFAVFMYVVMDGFDLGIGILFSFFHSKEDRDVMTNSVAPVWDGNETWLVLGGAGLFAVFPLAYATLLPALYMPLTLMLLGLIFRGVAFEMRFRAHTDATRLRWDRAFSWGSYAATLCQGIALGAFVQGVVVRDRAYAGGWWDWLTPFSLLTALALLVGYALLGACWLIWKTEGELQARARRYARFTGVGTVILIGAVSLFMLLQNLPFRERWISEPYVYAAMLVPAATLGLALYFWRAVKRGEITPFLTALGLFGLSYLGLGVSYWPVMIPPDVTLWDAAAPPSSQAFLLAGAVVLVPIILGYTAFTYWIFRGKVRHGEGYH